MCISYDAVACQVWLDPISMAPAGGQPLCADHAQRLSAPRGWVILDRRTSQSALVTSTGETVPAHDARGRGALPRRRLPRGWGQFDAPRLEFLAEDEPTEALADPVFPEPVVVEPVVVEPVVVEPVVVEPEIVVAEPEPAPLVAELQAHTIAERTPEPEVAEPEPEPAIAQPEPEPEVAVVEPEPEPEPVVEPSPAPRPRSKRPRSGESGPLGKPKGRLLSRAFEQSGPQRSAITESLDAEGTADA